MVDLIPMVLKAADIPLSVYYDTILRLHETIPIRTSEGKYVDREFTIGLYNDESEYKKILNEYYLEYNSLLKDSDYMSSLFAAGGKSNR